MTISQPISQSEINAILWKACDTFRGTVDPSEYKNYILVMLFVKYISDVWQEKLEQYRTLYNGDDEGIQNQLHSENFYLPPNATFQAIYAQRNASHLGDVINTALAQIEEANSEKLHGVFRNIDFNSEATVRHYERNRQLQQLLVDFNRLDMRPSYIGNQDVIGDAFDYLIGRFAADAGRSAAEFYTPPEVSSLVARLVTPQPGDRICDWACGLGSLLIKCAKEVGSHEYSLYGQERNNSTWALAKMNMFLHDISKVDIRWGDSLREPAFIEGDHLMTFNVVVAHPPFSLDRWGAEEASQDRFNRFWCGIPPKNKGDYAFILHMLRTLDTNSGRMAVIVPHGVLFRGGVEGNIRRSLIEKNLLDAVIGLPPNLFYGTGISAAILLFKRNKLDNTVLFIDASKEFEQSKYQNVLRDVDVQKIVNIYQQRATIDRYAQLVRQDEIAANDYNLNIPRYVDINIHFVQLTPPANYYVEKLGNVANISSGRTLASLENLTITTPTRIPYVTLQNLSDDGRIIVEKVEEFPLVETELQKSGYAQPGDILISTSGVIGKVVLVPVDFPYGVYFSTSIKRIRINNTKLDPLVAYHALRAEAAQVEFNRLSVGATIPHLSITALNEVRMLIPSKERQKEFLTANSEDTFSRSIAETIKNEVITPLESKNIDEVREQIIVVLENTLYTLNRTKPSTPQETILQKYPLPIALAYHRMQRSAYNPYEQLSRLIELYESITYFLYYLLLSDYLSNSELQKVYCPTKKEVRRAFDDFQMEPRLNFIQQMLEAVTQNSHLHLKVPALVQIDVYTPLNFVRGYRNHVYHSTSGSTEALRISIQELREQLDGLLAQLTPLKDYIMCRIDSYFFKKGQLHARLEKFTGVSYETDIHDVPFGDSEPENIRILRIEQEHVILFTPDNECLNLYPFYQVVSSKEFRHESHLCFMKSCKGGEIKGESIKFRSDVTLSGYYDLRLMAQNAGLIGP